MQSWPSSALALGEVRDTRHGELLAVGPSPGSQDDSDRLGHHDREGAERYCPRCSNKTYVQYNSNMLRCRLCAKQTDNVSDFINIHETDGLFGRIVFYLPIQPTRAATGVWPELICSACDDSLKSWEAFFKRINLGQILLSELLRGESVELSVSDWSEEKTTLFPNKFPWNPKPKRKTLKARPCNSKQVDSPQVDSPIPRRSRKAPKRFEESLQGDDLERLFKRNSYSGVTPSPGEDKPVESAPEQLKAVPETSLNDASASSKSEPVSEPLSSEKGSNQAVIFATSDDPNGETVPVQQFKCGLCHKHFSTKANLIVHQKAHSDDKKYFCETCGRQFAYRTSLVQHLRWHHGEKPFKCSVCNKAFSQKGNLQEHLRIHTGDKPFICTVCGKCLRTSSQYRIHSKRHLEKKPWKCTLCAKEFLQKESLDVHLRHHEGDRPFHCSQCKKSFADRWALKKHERVHTGEKPFVCSVCGKRFSDCSNLAKHRRLHADHNAEVGKDTVMSIIQKAIGNEDEADADDVSSDIEEIIYIAYDVEEEKENPTTPAKVAKITDSPVPPEESGGPARLESSSRSAVSAHHPP